MAQLADRPFPPGDYPAVVIGSGPGGLQVSHFLSRLGVSHAVLSADPGPGGMFRRFPLFQRLLSWTKPYAPAERGTRAYERFDWNSLLSDDLSLRAVMPTLMDGSSYFPSRDEMERNLATFAERAAIRVRYGCRWTATALADDGRFLLTTSDGEYRCGVAIFAVGVAEPSTPPMPGTEHATHYAETREAHSYAGRRVFLIGKQNSGFELASGLLPWARQIIVASPKPSRLSVSTRSWVGIRARYVQPYEDFVLSGGLHVLDASIAGVEPAGAGFRVHTRTTADGVAMTFEVDDVIAATGFYSPLLDLPRLGVRTSGQSRLPSQTPFWESADVPGIYFAGTITQGAAGLRKHGVPSNSGAVHGFRYNARVLASHITVTHFGMQRQRPAVSPESAVSYLLEEATQAPELWNQRSYLARVLTVDANRALRDEGILPLAHFVDEDGPDAVAVTLEHNAEGSVYPAVYIRAGGRLSEHLLPPDPLHDFRTGAHRGQVADALSEIVRSLAPV